MVTQLGMSEGLGSGGCGVVLEGRRTFGEALCRQKDREVQTIIRQSTQRCMDLINRHKKDIQNLALELQDKGTLNLEEIVKILGPRPFK